MDENGRTSDDSDHEAFSTVPAAVSVPAVALNGSVGSTQRKDGPPPLELSFHEDPAFTNLLSSFGEGNPAKLTLTDPAGSRRSMQALANVALMLSEEPATSPSANVGPSSISDAPVVPLASLEEKNPLPPLPKASIELQRLSSEQTPRISSDSKQSTGLSSPPTWGNPPLGGSRQRLDSNASASSTAGWPTPTRPDTTELVTRRLREASKDAAERGAAAVKLDREFVEAILHALQGSQTKYADLKGRLDGMKVKSLKLVEPSSSQ